eukprot:TRINITY_DN76443_c0_g1_i1.p1 TRINITY_DN76443_c0_g1~~TRINITY_DN76443_c0_g1_i1.p1  ORF type:complete len:257 (-),score=21.98 TRINITY_DN76443_c0_g1_i1:221-991(-)
MLMQMQILDIHIHTCLPVFFSGQHRCASWKWAVGNYACCESRGGLETQRAQAQSCWHTASELGSNAKSNKQIKTKYNESVLASQSKVRPTPTQPVKLVAGEDTSQFKKRPLSQFVRWLEENKTNEPGNVCISRDPGVNGSIAVVSGVKRARQLEVLLRYWRLDNENTWEAVGAEPRKESPNWVLVGYKIRGETHPNAREHTTYYIKKLKVQHAADHHVALMRQWSQANLEAASKLRGKTLMTEVLRQLAMLQGIGT